MYERLQFSPTWKLCWERDGGTGVTREQILADLDADRRR